ncbi:MAG UNVERIFIED_CONTAM: hypothetical protein LVR29_22760 [Microcystis novacekii LVE1205-3]
MVSDGSIVVSCKNILKIVLIIKLILKGILKIQYQRLSQEIQPIARTTMDFLTTCVEKVMEMLVFIVILWSISKTISIVLLVYTIIGNILATYITQQLNKVNKQQLEIEGTYKYAITHVRTHAESIAFFRGEEKELNIIQRKFNQVIKIMIERINWGKNPRNFLTAAINPLFKSSLLNCFPIIY